MSELSTQISRVNNKLQQLLKKHEILLHENQQQENIIAGLKDKEKIQMEEMALLRQQHLILKASLDKMDAKEKKELEQKINGYIRNIDKCISLLSHKQNI